MSVISILWSDSRHERVFQKMSNVSFNPWATGALPVITLASFSSAGLFIILITHNRASPKKLRKKTKQGGSLEVVIIRFFQVSTGQRNSNPAFIISVVAGLCRASEDLKHVGGGREVCWSSCRLLQIFRGTLWWQAAACVRQTDGAEIYELCSLSASGKWFSVLHQI